VTRVISLETANSELTAARDALEHRNAWLEQQLAEARAEAVTAKTAAAAAEAAALLAREDAAGRTPRPQRGLGILADLLDGQQLGVLEQLFLAGGCENETSHPNNVATCNVAIHTQTCPVALPTPCPVAALLLTPFPPPQVLPLCPSTACCWG
jgi:hypothetical protein